MPEGDRDVVLFGGGADGFGYARSQGRDGYNWTVGFDCRSGRAVPSAAYTRVLSQVTYSPIACLFEWETLTTEQPILIWTGGNASGQAVIYTWANGSAADIAPSVLSQA